MKDTVTGQFLLVLIAACSAAAQAVVSSTHGNETDGLSLLEFKKAIVLDPLRALASWNESTHLCDWEGVSCRTKDPCRVISLRLANLGLAGHISPWLGNLTFLRNLALPTNGFTGEIPLSLVHLRRLQTLYLSNNTLQGSIPTSLANCSSLKVMWLDNNNLVGQIPADFPPNLQELKLLSNGIGGTIPPSIANVTTLRKFSCAFNRIEGGIPDELAKLGGLEFLYLGSNQLVEVGNAKQLVILLLSSNKLSGDIPSSVGDCKSLEDIELDKNIFNGSIPTSFGKLFGLKLLNLSYNNLTGSVPASLGNLQVLEQLDLSFNHLEGKVPIDGIFKNATAVHIDGNQGLCGGAADLHLPACSVMSSDLSKRMLPLVLKIAIPLVCLLSLLAVVIVLLWRRKNHMRRSLSLLSFDSKFPKVSYKDLARATDGFSVSNLIGTGRYSSVYRGKILEEEIVVAVKVFCLEVRGAQRSFIAECNALRSIRHRNLVRILTACSSIDSSGNDFKALVYEFMPGGDLHNLLYSTEDNGNSSKLRYISLAQRLSIVVDMSDAMSYLHHNHHGSMVHCDLKPSNILLDDDMGAHVGDFGLARLQVYPASSSFDDSASVSSAAIRGTIGYVAPEYGGGCQVSTAADVYSFGVVLLEIFIRRSPTDGMFKDGLSIAKFAEINFPDKMLQIIDPQLVQELGQDALVAEDKGVHCLLSVLNVGLCCTKSSPSERIIMDEVAAKLHRIRDAYIGG